MAGHPNSTPAWKQEVNRRVAAHKNRRALASAESGETSAETRQDAGSPAAQAAARVAARYAQAPSYSQLQAADAKTAVRAAEIATQVALEAQAAARAALAGLKAKEAAKAAASAEAGAEAPVVVRLAQQQGAKPWAEAAVAMLPMAGAREPMDGQEAMALPAGGVEQETIQHAQLLFPVASSANPADGWWQVERRAEDISAGRDSGKIEGAPQEVLPHANLIKFPQEAVTPRRAGARAPLELAPHLDEHDRELSIFEVDPGTVIPEAVAEERWSEPGVSQWRGIELDEETALESVPVRDPEPAIEARTLDLAPFGLRFMAALVDSTLVAGVIFAVALVALTRMSNTPPLRIIEMAAIVGFFSLGMVYQALFFLLSNSTPGMKYARISLCTFDDQVPNHSQLQSRVVALLLSLLPLGVGVAWAIFDDDHLCWHDRLSSTYLRKS